MGLQADQHQRAVQGLGQTLLHRRQRTHIAHAPLQFEAVTVHLQTLQQPSLGCGVLLQSLLQTQPGLLVLLHRTQLGLLTLQPCQGLTPGLVLLQAGLRLKVVGLQAVPFSAQDPQVCLQSLQRRTAQARSGQQPEHGRPPTPAQSPLAGLHRVAQQVEGGVHDKALNPAPQAHSQAQAGVSCRGCKAWSNASSGSDLYACGQWNCQSWCARVCSACRPPCMA